MMMMMICRTVVAVGSSRLLVEAYQYIYIPMCLYHCVSDCSILSASCLH